MMKEDHSAIILLFGATGDLAKRKLFPALYSLYCDGYLPERFAVIGMGRKDLQRKEYHEHIQNSLEEFSRHHLNTKWDAFISHFYYSKLDVYDSNDYADLSIQVKRLEKEYDIKGNRFFYLAIAPELFEPVTYQLKESGLLDTAGWKRLIIEKPFGSSFATAEELNNKLTQVFKEEEIYRIDHYLGKEMVQNIQVIRFANSFFEPLWNNRYIDNIQLTSSETVGVENRGGYYDKIGALRDMVQNHMLQMVTMIAMEPPSRLKAEAIRDEKVKVLRSIRRFETQEDVANQVVRGQYVTGQVQGSHVAGYQNEESVDPASKTETFVAAKIMVDNFRWAGVPFYIRTGKRLPAKATEIIIQFKNLPYLYFNKEGNLSPNLLVIRIYPEEGIYLKFNAKKPGTDGKILPISMDFSHDFTVGINSPEAYERLIKDGLEGDSTYFTRWDEVSLAWKIVDPIIEAWEDNSSIPLCYYKAGEWGPKQAADLLEKDHFSWWQVHGETR